MKQQGEEKKQTKRRKTLDSLCSTSGLLLSVVCCIALIHVELRIREHHRLISHSVTCCDHMETKILRKVQEDYGRWQETKSSHSEGHWQETGGEFRLLLILCVINTSFLVVFSLASGLLYLQLKCQQVFLVLANGVVAGCSWKVNNKNENIRWLLAMSRFHFGSFSEHVCVALLAFFTEN